MDNIEEMDKFLETYNLPRLIQEETDNLNSEIESVINSQQTKVQGWATSMGNSTKHTKKNLYPYFSNYSKKLKMREHSQIQSMGPTSP